MTGSDWPQVPLGEVITMAHDRVPVRADQEYPNFGIYSFGRGLFPKSPIRGTTSSAVSLYRASAGQFVYSRLFAFEGAYGLVTQPFDGCFVSNEFPLFDCNPLRILPSFLGWLFRVRKVWDDIARLTTGMGNRRQRVKPEALLAYTIPLPRLDVQKRIVATIDCLDAKIAEAKTISRECNTMSTDLSLAAYHEISASAPRQQLGDIAPSIRRPATIDPASEYPQVSVRSFGKGTFHNPPLQGSEITWQKPHLVKQHDILVSNIKAWEGAIAVAGTEDDGRFGSHRYLTFVPTVGVVTSHFLCFYLLSAEGLYQVGEASPGSADRNRSLSARKMLNISVPVPPFEQQQRFDALLTKIIDARGIRSDAAVAFDAMLPSILDRAFKGAL